MEKMLSPEEVAELLSVPVKTVYSWRYRRTGPPGFKVGKHVRYQRADVLAWLAERADDRTADASA